MTKSDTITREAGTPESRSERPRHISFGHRLEYAGYLLIRAAIRALPFELASDLMAWLWQLIAPHMFRHERALKHLRLAYPEKTEVERAAIAHAMWGHLGRTMAESFVIDRIANSADMITLEISPEIQKFIDEKRPMILAGLHLGNWELAAVGGSQLELDLAGVYQRILNPLVDNAIRQARLPYYPSGLYTKGHDTVKILMRLMRQGKSIGIVSDLRDNRGLPVPFFGQLANSSPFPAMLSVLYDAPIVAVQCVRLKYNAFRVVLELVTARDSESRDEMIAARTAELHAIFERFVRRNPEQWMWAHRRWDQPQKY